MHINDHYFVLYIIDEKITEMPAICVSDIDDFNNLIDVDSLVRKHGFLKDRRPEGGGRGFEWEPFLILQENKVYVPNSTRHTSLLTVKVTQANS